MRIHHLNLGSLYPRFPQAVVICYCLLVETNRGLVLIDTGFGTKDYTEPSLRMRFFRPWMGALGQFNETAAHQISEMGFDLKDVRHIILTHLHLDHAGGLRDFPDAEVHVHRVEYQAANRPHGLMGFAYDRTQWAHHPNWVLHDHVDGDWFGFESIQVIRGLLPEISLIPLPGHTPGHCGVSIRRSEGWLFHCGDAASPFHRDTDLHDRGEDLHHADFLPRRFAYHVIGPHVPRLRKLIRDHGAQVRTISSHDIYSFSELRGG